MRSKLWLLLSLVSQDTLAQTPPVLAEPELGWVREGDGQSLRMIRGLAGVAKLGPLLDGGGEIVASVPARRYLIVRTPAGDLSLARPAGTHFETWVPPGLGTAWADVAISGDGTAALVGGPAEAIVMAGLPHEPRVAGRLRPGIETRSSAAVNDAGSIMASITARGLAIGTG